LELSRKIRRITGVGLDTTLTNRVKIMSMHAENTDFQNCPQCQAQMLREMRFCRNCGYRLGEGVEDYTATRRFDAPPVATANATAPLPPSAQTNPQAWANVPQARPLSPAATWQPRQAKRGMHWLVWVIVGVVASSAVGGAFLGSRGLGPHISINKKAAVPRSYLGVDNLDTADNEGGVFIGKITPPGSAADKAGLVGGDIIVAFDGQAVTKESQLIKLLTNTPVGKTVEIVYLRDGQRQTTKLTTLSEEDNDKLDDAFDHQPHGLLGVDDLERVPVPGDGVYGVRVDGDVAANPPAKFGVRVGEVSQNRPAYMAGLKEGDIIVEYNGVPIRTAGELGMRIDRTPPLSPAKVVVIRTHENAPPEKLLFEFKVGRD
jgi:membrane-associated protease RseP (regulator of RpoE activity)